VIKNNWGGGGTFGKGGNSAIPAYEGTQKEPIPFKVFWPVGADSTGFGGQRTERFDHKSEKKKRVKG